MTSPSVTFERFQRPLPGLSGADRLRLFDALPESERAAMWQRLRERTEDRRFLDGDAAFVSRRPKPRRINRQSPIASGGDDWRRGTEALAAIPSEVYIPVLTDSDPLPGGRVRCPLPDHDDRHPSATYRKTVWYCHRCGEGGGIFQLGSALSGLGDHGDEFGELRRWLAEQMLGVTA